MVDPPSKACTAFLGHGLLLSGPLADVAMAVRRSAGTTAALLVFDDATGRVIDLDLRGGDAERLARPARAPTVVGRHRSEAGETAGAVPEDGQDQRSRGRPKLGVVAREVTLLPRHWEWLADQPGGASATLRRLVDDARKAVDPRSRRRAAHEAAYRFMHAIGGDLPGYEEATRALFADDRPALEERIAAWPEDIRAYALRLAFGAADPPNS
ncbi:hypothetical protein DFR50_13829 [Roseiarcus fermentans]|uniref:DUF2239 family protein n=1 Tax=Roseiarcus fermentans TaxID=1473586 RepID=A0A366ET39_9HYPH|nr:DUF2239 family protein [Roseiarcus fermentans]RBP04645.1 hypothetical protein DFR50_13829 [Roseiarcus fermentans]